MNHDVDISRITLEMKISSGQQFSYIYGIRVRFADSSNQRFLLADFFPLPFTKINTSGLKSSGWSFRTTERPHTTFKIFWIDFNWPRFDLNLTLVTSRVKTGIKTSLPIFSVTCEYKLFSNPEKCDNVFFLSFLFF